MVKLTTLLPLALEAHGLFSPPRTCLGTSSSNIHARSEHYAGVKNLSSFESAFQSMELSDYLTPYPGQPRRYNQIPDLAAIPSVNFRYRKRPFGTVPEACYDTAALLGLETTDFEVYDINFADCPVSTPVCRHKDFPVSIEATLRDLSRVPPNARQLLRTLLLLPAAEDGRIAMTDMELYDLRVHQDVRTVPFIWFHEFAHIIDRHLAAIQGRGEYASGWSHDFESAWSRALSTTSKDTCMATEYAKSHPQEAFAETAILVAAYLRSGVLPKRALCLMEQFLAAKEVLTPYFEPSQKNCSVPFKHPNQPSICVSAEAEAQGLCKHLDRDWELNPMDWTALPAQIEALKPTRMNCLNKPVQVLTPSLQMCRSLRYRSNPRCAT